MEMATGHGGSRELSPESRARRRAAQAAAGKTRKVSAAFNRGVDEAQRVAHRNAMPAAKRAAAAAADRQRDIQAEQAQKALAQRTAAAAAQRRHIEAYGVAPTGTDPRSLDLRMERLARMMGEPVFTSPAGKFGGFTASERAKIEERRAREARQAKGAK